MEMGGGTEHEATVEDEGYILSWVRVQAVKPSTGLCFGRSILPISKYLYFQSVGL